MYAVIGCVSISVFASLIGILVGIANSAITLKVSVITAGFKKSIIKKQKKKHDKKVMLAKTKLNTIEVLILKLINSNISHVEFVLVNNVLKEYDDTKEEIKNSN